MSIITSLTTAISRTLDLVSSTATSAEKTLDIANHYVTEQHKVTTRTVTKNAQLKVAKHHVAIQDELEEDENLKEMFAEIEKDW